MEKEELEMLIRIDERLNEINNRHLYCDIPKRIAALEQQRWRVEGGIALLIVLVGSGRVIDFIYTVMHYKT